MHSKYTTPHTKPPSKKQQLLNEFSDRYPHYILNCNLLGGLFLFGGLLSTLEIDIFRMTFISVYILLSIWVIMGIIVKPFFKKTLDIYLFNPSSPGHIPTWLHYIYIFPCGTEVEKYGQVYIEKQKMVFGDLILLQIKL